MSIVSTDDETLYCIQFYWIFRDHPLQFLSWDRGYRKAPRRSGSPAPAGRYPVDSTPEHVDVGTPIDKTGYCVVDDWAINTF